MNRKRYNLTKTLKFRINLLLVIFLILFLFIILRLYYLQVIKYEYYAQKAERQYSSSFEFYDRGSIYVQDKSGNLISIASIKSGYKLAIKPSKISKSDLNKLYKALQDLGYKIDKEKLFKKAANKHDPYEEILSKLSKSDVEYIKSKKIKNIDFVNSRWRYYPLASLAAHTVGFVAYKDTELHGVYGLERYYDDILYRDSKNLGVNFFAELFGDVKNLVTGKQVAHGSLISTIDINTQTELEKILKKTAKKWKSSRVSGIIYNPQNGEVVAMASYPNFDLNNFAKTDPKLFSNPLVEDVYEMGSIIKAITMASALDSGVVNENSVYNDTGSKVYNGSRISNYDKRARGPNTKMQEILSQSLNVGAAWLYEKMGKERFRKYFEEFGLREETGIDLPNEALNLTSNLESPRDIEYATASFGQGVAFTPVSVVRAFGALSTGVLKQIHVVKAIKYDSGIIKYKDYSDYDKRVLKPKTVETISRMLTNVTDKALLRGKYKKEHYSIATKTGTAQIAKPGGGYYEDLYNHTFIGYFPAFNPRFVVLLINEKPKGAKYASHTLTEPFFEIVDFLINYYNIKPDR